MTLLTSLPSPCLDRCDRNTLLEYYENAWHLEETLLHSPVKDDAFYISPDPLRNPLIFYLGHSAAFYLNKLLSVGLLDQPLDPDYETLFERGVDPSSASELDAANQATHWPQVETVQQYRQDVKATVTDVIERCELDQPIQPDHPLWALIMGIEHQRIHFETSSMLLRQLPPEQLQRPQHWQYAATGNPMTSTVKNAMVDIAGGQVTLGKPKTANTYGWDSEYGQQQVTVKPFAASQYLITNGEFRQFVQAGGYHNPELWDAAAWQWITTHHIQHPKFWLPTPDGYRYRAMFDEFELPLDWPVEVTHYEATAYCYWQGDGRRLLTEAEWHLAVAHADSDDNLNLKFGSPCPVGLSDPAPSGLYDLRGNVWEWLSDDFAPLPGFAPHRLYADYSTPYFDAEHKLMRGGAWASTGAYASPTCRNWFRRNFYQHAGFRVAQDC